MTFFIRPPKTEQEVLEWRKEISRLLSNTLDVNIVSPIEANGAVPINIQDQTSPTLIVPLNQTANTTTVSVLAVTDTRTVTVTDTTGFVDKAFVVIASIPDNRYYTGYQVGAVAGNVVTLDTPLDFAYPIGATATNGISNMNVNGSVTTEVFSLRAADPGLPIEIDVTRIIFVCETAGAVDLTKFGDIAGGLISCVVLRCNDGIVNNIFNAKTNADLAGFMYDFSVAAATNPAQGQDGFTGRMTFGGQNKMGVVIRIGAGEDLEMLIQDDLSSLQKFQVIVEGHVVTD